MPLIQRNSKFSEINRWFLMWEILYFGNRFGKLNKSGSIAMIRKKELSVFIRLSFLVIFLFLISCGTKTVMMTVLRPAEINLKHYPKIALGDFVNPRGRIDQHALDLRDALTQQLIATKRFEVVDRQTLGKIIQEQKLAASGLIDEKSAPTLGKLLGASALIFGRITTDRYHQELVHAPPYKDKKGKSHQRHSWKGKYELSANIKIVDVQTGKILTAKELSAVAKAETSALDKAPPKIDSNALYRKCVAKIAAQFRRMVAPYQIKVKAQFLVDDKVPETKKAIGLFKAGEWDAGEALLKRAAMKPGLKPELRAKVYYDLGLAQMYLGQHDAAIENIRHALELKPDESRYQKVLRTAKEEKAKAEKLKQQL